MGCVASDGGSAHVINLSLLAVTDRMLIVSRSAYGPTTTEGQRDSECFLDIITLPEAYLGA